MNDIKDFANKAWATRHMNALIEEYGDHIVEYWTEERGSRWIVVLSVINGQDNPLPSSILEQAEIRIIDEDEGEGRRGMSATLAKYRTTYEPTVAYSGKASADNGDQVAEILRGMTPSQVCALADKVFGEAEGTHEARYEGLNPGQRRMCAGNRIRAAVKRGEATIDDLR